METIFCASVPCRLPGHAPWIHIRLPLGLCRGGGASGGNIFVIRTITIAIINTSIIIIITRPKPAYGRQGLAGLWGQDTDQAGTFWGVVNISLRAFSAQLGWRLTWNHKNDLESWKTMKTDLEPWITVKKPPGTLKNQKNPSETRTNQPGTILA